MTTGPEAGYYADPSIPGYIRYWDGTQWVAGTSRPAPADANAGSPEPARPQADVWTPEPPKAQAPAQTQAPAQSQPPVRPRESGQFGIRGSGQGRGQGPAQPQESGQFQTQGRGYGSAGPQESGQFQTQGEGQGQRRANAPVQPQESGQFQAQPPVQPRESGQFQSQGEAQGQGRGNVPAQPRESGQFQVQPPIQPQESGQFQAQPPVQPPAQERGPMRPEAPRHSQPEPQTPVAQSPQWSPMEALAQSQAPVRQQPPVPPMPPQAPSQPLFQSQASMQAPVQQQPPVQTPFQQQPPMQPDFSAQTPFQQQVLMQRQAPAQQLAPQAPAPAPVAPEPEPVSVATMVVPSAFANSGAYNQGWGGASQSLASPFAGIPGFTGRPDLAQEEPEPQVKLARLASPGSRLLAKIIDIFLAVIMSTPATVTLILVAHRHDHGYVESLRLKATAPYTTLGMDATGIALWVLAALALLLVALVYEAFRVGGGGQTTGRRLLGIRVVRAGTADKLGSGAALFRGLLFWAFLLLPVINILTLGGVLWGRPYHQGLHDKLTRSVTIRVS